VFSSNYALYVDLSNRVMSELSRFSPIQQIYSIDESWLDCTGLHDMRLLAYDICASVLKQTGIPVNVGIGTSKTLTKVSSFVSKRHPKSKGVFSFNTLTPQQQEHVLSHIPVEEVWNIGRRLTASLNALGIYSALQLRDADPPSMRARFGVVIEKTIRELRGESCIEIEKVAPAKKQIISSRSFGQHVTERADLEEALAHFVSNAAVKLRQQQSVAGMLHVFIQTDRFREDHPQYCPSIAVPLPMPTANTLRLQHWAVQALRSLYRDGFQYKKAGVMLADIHSQHIHQPDLFEKPQQESLVLMNAMDRLNEKFGKGTIRLAQDRAPNAWAMRQDRKLLAYTTDWEQLRLCR